MDRPKIIGYPSNNAAARKKEIDSFKYYRINVIDYKIDVERYNTYMKKANYGVFANYFNGGKGKIFMEKSLEHCLAADFLNLSKDDILIDIAGGGSPASDIYKKIYGCTTYKQDLHYPAGLHNNIIGSDAAAMPLPDNFATKLSLHCSFEHFEGDADIKFIKEAHRILKQKGKVCILPLYIFTDYAIQIDPAIMPIEDLKDEQDTIIFCRKNWKNRFGRYYDVPHFVKRIKNHSKGFDLRIYFVQNEKDIDSSCYVKFILMLEKE
ncbi:MAG: methyltransferase domain-containing protein [Candidatus Omnitrophica bacterium]|nr:methyltransferase domain-containing protein [Candidatus Omnitrophota bacterium]